MKPFHFDLFGWLITEPSADTLPLEGRQTDIAPPDTPLPEGQGWNFTGHAWVAAPLNPPQAAPIPVGPRRMAVGSFFDRFGPAKWAILADPSPAVQALVKDCSVRSFIDLDRADLPAALALLVQAGHAVDVEKILGAPVQAGERP